MQLAELANVGGFSYTNKSPAEIWLGDAKLGDAYSTSWRMISYTIDVQKDKAAILKIKAGSDWTNPAMGISFKIGMIARQIPAGASEECSKISSEPLDMQIGTSYFAPKIALGGYY